MAQDGTARPQSIVLSIFNRQQLPVHDITNDPDSIVVAIHKKPDESEYNRRREIDPVVFIHNFIFSRITFVKVFSILCFIASAISYYSAPSVEEPLSYHKMLLLPSLDLTCVILGLLVYIFTIHEIGKRSFNTVIIMETVYSLTILMMILISAIIVITDAIETRKIMRIISASLAFVAIACQLCSSIMTLLKYRPTPRSRRSKLEETIKFHRDSRSRRASRRSIHREISLEAKSKVKVTKF